jgi:glutamate racemase
VFDSGVGGLSVLRQIIQQLPTESILYFGDTAHVPYGGRPLDEVKTFALDICSFLARRGAKMIVMACNISSAVAIDEARHRHPEIPILGVIEPGSAAALATGSTNIGVLATQGTVSSRAYSKVITALSSATIVTEMSCPLFVPIVEDEEVDSPRAFAATFDYLSQLANSKPGAIILGCTHYPFLQTTLSKVASTIFPENDLPLFIDPAIETARVAGRILSKYNAMNPSTQSGSRNYFVSGSPDHFEKNGSFFLGKSIIHAAQIKLG